MTLVETVVELITLDTDEDHLTCCVDDDLGLCGKDLSAFSFGPINNLCSSCSRNQTNNICPKGYMCFNEPDHEGN